MADTAMKSGSYSATYAVSDGASIKTFDASRASANLKLTTGLISIENGELKAGSGKDTIDVSTTLAGSAVSGGKGADLFQVADVAANVTITDTTTLREIGFPLLLLLLFLVVLMLLAR